MMEHEKTDQDILSDVRALLLEDDVNGRDFFRSEWQFYRAEQLLMWLSDNIERIKRMAQGGPVSERVPDRLPQDSTLWSQPSLHTCTTECDHNPSTCPAYRRMVGYPGYGA